MDPVGAVFKAWSQSTHDFCRDVNMFCLSLLYNIRTPSSNCSARRTHMHCRAYVYSVRTRTRYCLCWVGVRSRGRRSFRNCAETAVNTYFLDPARRGLVRTTVQDDSARRCPSTFPPGHALATVLQSNIFRADMST
jgi:hypothetical protein